jgi:hypothetical protein
MKSPVPQFAFWRALAVGVLSVAALMAQAPDLDHWTWRNPLPTGSNLSRVVWSGNQFVAVGDAGTIATSPDGVSWTSRAAGTSNNLSYIIWSGSQFVVVGGAGTILTSEDGVSWTSRTSGTANPLNSVTWSGKQFVVVGGVGTILTSVDGVNWTIHSLNTKADLGGVVWNGSIFVVTGSTGLNGGVILTSKDGESWDISTPSIVNYIESLVWNGSLFVAIGPSWSPMPGNMFTLNSYSILTSPDGVSWTSRASYKSSWLRGMMWTGHQFVVFYTGSSTSQTALLTSKDGVTWTSQSANVPWAWNDFMSLAWNESQYVAVGPKGMTETSPDLVNWTDRTSGTKNNLQAGDWSGSLFVIVDDSGMISTSPDGVSWTTHASGTSDTLRGVAWCGSQFVAVGGRGTILTSADGVNWTTRLSGTTLDLHSVTWNGSQLVAVGDIGRILTSVDGVEWVDRSSGSDLLYGVTWNGSQFLAVGWAGAVLTSPDGVSWTKRSSGTAKNLCSVTWGGGQFVAVGGAILSSPDGVSWTDHFADVATSTDGLSSVVYTGNQFVGVGGNSTSDTVYTSPDGLKWTARKVNVANAFYCVMWSGSQFVIAGSRGAIMTAGSQPMISTQPLAQTATAGASVTFMVAISGTSAPTYQWRLNGTPINGATNAMFTITSVQPSDAGSYDVVVSGNVTSSAATLTVDYSRLANLSVRAPAGTGDQTLILGFYVGGTGSKQVLIRGVGPTLAQYGVSGVLADPQLKLFNAKNTLINQNDDWGGSAALANAFAAVQDFALPASSKDAALLVALLPDGYTAQVNGAGTSTGVTLIEAYEADTGMPGARFTALSARNQVGTGENILIVGFAVTGNAPKKLLIRGIGPTLANYGVSGALADPQLALFDRTSTKISENDNWGGATALSDAFTATQAFPLSTNSKDAALLVTLQPGVYSAQVSGVGGTTGVALVEVYEMP